MSTPQYKYNPNEDIVDRMRSGSKKRMNYLIVVINLLVFLLVTVTGGSESYDNMMRWGAAYTPSIQSGQYYRLFTSMFLHFGIEHLGGNMLLLLFLGDYLERYVGKAGYLLIYLCGGIFGNVCSYRHEVKMITGGESPALAAGASGAIFAVVGAMIVLLICHKGKVEDLTFQRMVLMAVGSLLVGFQTANVDNAAHLGGFAAGIVIMGILYPVLRRIRGEEHADPEERLS